MEDFEGIRYQIHSKIRDKIDENPASEEEEERIGQADGVIGETSPMYQRKQRKSKNEAIQPLSEGETGVVFAK